MDDGNDHRIYVARADQAARLLTLVIPDGVSHAGVRDMHAGQPTERWYVVPPYHAGTAVGSAAAGWGCDLPDGAAVRLDGGYPDVSDGPDARPVRRVVVTMPDFTAEAIGRSLARLSPHIGGEEVALAYALTAAAAEAGFRRRPDAASDGQGGTTQWH